jgi:hypothetical protein
MRVGLFGAIVLLMLCLSGAASWGAPQRVDRTGTVTLGSGLWDSTKWRFSASESQGALCLEMRVGSHDASGSCGSILPRRSASGGHGLYTWMSDNGGEPDYVAGAILADSSNVVISLSNGKVIRTHTIAPPRGFAGKIAFFVARKPCGTQAVGIVGRSQSGRIVATWRDLHPGSHLVYRGHSARITC